MRWHRLSQLAGQLPANTCMPLCGQILDGYQNTGQLVEIALGMPKFRVNLNIEIVLQVRTIGKDTG